MNNILQANIIKQIGIDQLPPERQEEILLKIGEVIFGNIMLRVVEILGDEDKTQLDKLLSEQKDDGEPVLQFLQTKIPELDQIVADEVAQFKQESVDLMNAIKKD